LTGPKRIISVARRAPVADGRWRIRLRTVALAGEAGVVLTVTICQGLPASGKSTWAKQQVAQRPNEVKRINKDDLRSMLDGGHWSKSNEKFIEAARDSLIVMALDAGKHVIVDDTNLAPRHIERIRALVHGIARVEVKFFEVDLDEAIRRDLLRPASVGERVIRDMWRTFLAPTTEPYGTDPSRPTAIIVDLDGTYAIMAHRGPYDTARCETDVVNEVVRSIASQHGNVLLMSGRSEEFRPHTERWLDANNIAYTALHMRAENDMRKDAIVKRELFDTHVAGVWNVAFVLDDRDQVVEMWRSLGLTCLQVAPGDF
jgi:predicted kinase